MDPAHVRRALRGALMGAALFGGVALVQVFRSGTPLASVLQPVLVLATLGLTVGGLAGPLVGEALSRYRARRDA